MRKFFLNIYFWPIFCGFTLIGLALLPCILFVKVVLFSQRLDSALRCAIRFYGWVLVCVLPFFGPVRVVYRTQELPPAAIFVANHNSAVDPYIFGAIPIENAFVTTWPFKIPVYNIFMRLAGYANAGKGWDEVRQKGKKVLESGSYLTIWPEGHRSRDGQLGRFRKGAFSLAVETGMPIVPVCILGSGKVLPPGKRCLCPGIIQLIVLDPVYPGKKEEGLDRAKELRSHIRTMIENTLRDNDHFVCDTGS